MNEQRTAVLEQSLEQDDIDAVFRDITDLIDCGSMSDEDLQQRIMEKPGIAFDVYFTVLQRLYQGRTRTDTDSLGTVVSQFVTRNPERTRADLHFRELAYDSGSVERVVEVTRPQGQPFFVSYKDNHLRIATQVYSRGMNRRVEVDPDSPRGEQLLEAFFSHYTDARDQVMARSETEADAANAQAVRFLHAKLVGDRQFSPLSTS